MPFYILSVFQTKCFRSYFDLLQMFFWQYHILDLIILQCSIFLPKLMIVYVPTSYSVCFYFVYAISFVLVLSIHYVSAAYLDIVKYVHFFYMCFFWMLYILLSCAIVRNFWIDIS